MKRFKAALALMEAGESEALIFTKVDRASRCTEDFAWLIRLSEEQDWIVGDDETRAALLSRLRGDGRASPGTSAPTYRRGRDAPSAERSLIVSSLAGH